MPQIIFQAESDIDQINANYFCADQTNMNQTLTSRNFSDCSKSNLYAPNSEVVIGALLYSSFDCQESVDFSVIFQNISIALAVNYEGTIGSLSFSYTVINDEYITKPVQCNVSNVSAAFSQNLNSKILVNISPTNERRILYTLYNE
jgi:hypothetical protein